MNFVNDPTDSQIQPSEKAAAQGGKVADQGGKVAAQGKEAAAAVEVLGLTGMAATALTVGAPVAAVAVGYLASKAFDSIFGD
jgi:hypothetical protein